MWPQSFVSEVSFLGCQGVMSWVEWGWDWHKDCPNLFTLFGEGKVCRSTVRSCSQKIAKGIKHGEVICLSWICQLKFHFTAHLTVQWDLLHLQLNLSQPVEKNKHGKFSCKNNSSGTLLHRKHWEGNRSLRFETSCWNSFAHNVALCLFHYVGMNLAIPGCSERGIL